MTEQEAFDTVVRHLAAQGSKSLLVADTVHCAYRGAGGRKCAVGVLIPDAVYEPRFEGKSWKSLCAYEPSLEALQLPTTLMANLQQVHDNYPVSHWHDDLAAVATRFGLDKAALNEAFANYL